MKRLMHDFILLYIPLWSGACVLTTLMFLMHDVWLYHFSCVGSPKPAHCQALFNLDLECDFPLFSLCREQLCVLQRPLAPRWVSADRRPLACQVRGKLPLDAQLAWFVAS